MSPLTVLIITDRGLVAAGLGTLIAPRTDTVLVSTAANWNEGLLMARLISPDLVITYAASPYGRYLQLCSETKEQSPHTRVLVIANDSRPSTVLSFLSHGATGYIVETTPVEQLVDDIFRVGMGEPIVRGMMVGVPVGDKIASGPVTNPNQTEPVSLSNSELSILCLLAQGKANKEIARALSISEATVKWHLGRVYSKLRVGGRYEAVLLLNGYSLDEAG